MPPAAERGSWTGSLILIATSVAVAVWLLALPVALRQLIEQRYLVLGLERLALAVLTSALLRVMPAALVLAGALLVAGAVLYRRRGLLFAPLRPAWLAVAGVLALLWPALWMMSWLTHPAADETRPDLVLVSIDTLRADRLGCYGNERHITPNLDRVAGQGLRFARAVAPASWTLPSMASVLTGLPALGHGAVRMDTALSPALVTLPEVLADAGYRTVAVVSHVFVGRPFGFSQGIEVFEDAGSSDHADVSSERLTRRAIEHAGRSDSRPLFLWVHYFDPHYTYVRHPEYSLALPAARSRYTWSHLEERVRELAAQGGEPDPGDPWVLKVGSVYDEEVAHTDHWIGELLDGLRDLGRRRPLVVAILGDHGELFFEHDRFGHGDGVSQELIHVPLIFGGDIPPGLRGGVVERTVSLAAVASTFAALAGIEGRHFPGPSLIRLALTKRPYGLAVFAAGGADGALAVLRGDLKLVRTRDGEEALYRVDVGGRETRTDEVDLELLRRSLGAALDDLVLKSTSVEAPTVKLPEEARKDLRALGYLQ